MLESLDGIKANAAYVKETTANETIYKAPGKRLSPIKPHEEEQGVESPQISKQESDSTTISGESSDDGKKQAKKTRTKPKKNQMPTRATEITINQTKKYKGKRKTKSQKRAVITTYATERYPNRKN